MTLASRITPVLIMLVVGVTLGSATAHSRGAPDSFADLAERLLPSVVNISTTQVQQKAEKGGPQVPRFPRDRRSRIFSRSFSIASSAKRRSDALCRWDPVSLSAKTDTWSLTIMLLPKQTKLR